MANTIPTMKELHTIILATLRGQAVTTSCGKALTAAAGGPEHMDRLIINQAGNLAQILHAKIAESLEATAEELAGRGFDVASSIVVEMMEAA